MKTIYGLKCIIPHSTDHYHPEFYSTKKAADELAKNGNKNRKWISRMFGHKWIVVEFQLHTDK